MGGCCDRILRHTASLTTGRRGGVARVISLVVVHGGRNDEWAGVGGEEQGKEAEPRARGWTVDDEFPPKNELEGLCVRLSVVLYVLILSSSPTHKKS